MFQVLKRDGAVVDFHRCDRQSVQSDSETVQSGYAGCACPSCDI